MRYLLWIEYDGAPFCGWQIQANGVTVQQKIQEALSVVLKAPHAIVGSGRTDAGVHAFKQVAHFDTTSAFDIARLHRSLNGLLPPEIRIRKVEAVADDFHARFDAKIRYYRYKIAFTPVGLERHLRWEIRPQADIHLMNEAANQLLGTHHFGSFCIAKSETQNKVCTISMAHFLPDEASEYYTFHIQGNRFLQGMVRAIVGTLVEIGQGKRPVNDISHILAAQDRTQAGAAAPAKGLCLYDVLY
jgi:tRNA pseudouridine38-40 synthase